MSTRGGRHPTPGRARHRLLDQPAWCGWTGGAPLGPAPTRRVTHPPGRSRPLQDAGRAPMPKWRHSCRRRQGHSQRQCVPGFAEQANTDAQLPSTIARQVRSVVQDPLSPLLRRPTPCSRSPPRCGTADWLASSLVSCEPARPATRFSVWASTAWIWLRRRVLARAEVGHPGAKDAGSAVATEADRV